MKEVTLKFFNNFLKQRLMDFHRADDRRDAEEDSDKRKTPSIVATERRSITTAAVVRSAPRIASPRHDHR